MIVNWHVEMRPNLLVNKTLISVFLRGDENLLAIGGIVVEISYDENEDILFIRFNHDIV